MVGVGIGIYGERPVLREVYIKNTAGHGLLTDGPSSGAPAGDYFSMEGHFERIFIDTVQKHGWYFNGPHDSTILHCVAVDAGQATTNTWDALYANSPARWFSFHGWTRSLGKRHRYAANIQSGAAGSQFIGGQFEGSESANVNLLANNC
ncbi:hypothetical protein CH75_04980 [Dyella jiangningensis]|nr:hypothetical protein CH75_04980 [Dyella jiangningensis]